MQNHRVVVVITITAMLVLAGCSKPEPKGAKAEKLAEELAKAEKERQAEEAKKRAIKPIEGQRLQELLPTGSATLAREEAANSQEQMGEHLTSKAWAAYGKGSVRIELIDFAGAKKKIDEGYWWTSRNVDQKLKDGYEKTGVIQQWYKTYERQNTPKNTVQLLVNAGERFIVSAEGTGVEMNQLKELVEQINFKTLANLK